MRSPRLLFTTALLTFAACTPEPVTVEAESDYLYLWSASADTTQPDFLAVVDITEDSVQYGRLVTTLAVPGLRNGPHHSEHEMPADGMLFANGFGSGQTFIFDLTTPDSPRIAKQFGDIAGYSHPHSFVRMPNGNVLATFQMRHDSSGTTPGGLVELTPAGEAVRSSAPMRGVDINTRVYSAGVNAAIDRIVTTTTDMHGDHAASRQVQVWRLSDFTLLHTITLPDGPAGGESMYTAEPRLLSDGRTMLVSTFNCSLYLMDGVESDAPSARLVASFPRMSGESCAIPVVVGRYYLVTVPAWNAVVSLDISDPAKPREVSRMTLDSGDVPHWIAIAPDAERLVVTGYGNLQHRVVMARFDSTSGQLSIDSRFRDVDATAAGFRLDNKTWPHGGTYKAIPHGAVFSRR